MKSISIIIFIILTLSACETTNRVIGEEFTVRSNSPQIALGNIEAQLDDFNPFSSGIQRHNFSVIYFPAEDAVCLQYRVDFITYRQFWSLEGRFAFVKALEEYNRSYDARDLPNSGRGTRSTYGRVQGYLTWRSQSFTMEARANVFLDLGYTFVERSPYFVINQRETFFKANHSNNNRSSQERLIYFTREQAAVLAQLFDENLLQNLTVPDSFNLEAATDFFD